MDYVYSYGSEGWSELSEKYVKKFIGNNKDLNTAFNKGGFDTSITIGDDIIEVAFPGRRMPGRLRQLDRLITYVLAFFRDIGEDGKFFFTVRDFTDDSGDIVFECSNGSLFSYNIESRQIIINEGCYTFSGNFKDLEREFLAFIGWVLLSKVPVKVVSIYPKRRLYFSQSYFEDVEELFVGFREAVFDEGIQDNSSFKMLCGYEEKPDEYVMAILV